MQRRCFIQTALGAFALPMANHAIGATVTSPTISMPARENMISKFGFVTDVHYCVKPVTRIPHEDSVRVYRVRLPNCVRRPTSLM